ncbi:MAG TPA: adenylate/guanylate cyclase domain-containing protein [Spirochaetia bacterium]|nr:adenylate/guanylate cyclase domain-containing protein [Spirochaetia bacterium]
MANESNGGVRTVRVNFSLRLKIILTFLIVGMAVSALLSFSVYRILNDGLLRQMQGRVLDLATIGTNVVDTGALARLRTKIAKDLPTDVVDRIESSADFRVVSEELNKVRGVERKLVRYIYTFAPTEDPKTALYLVDGDVLDLTTKRAAGEKTEDISHFASVFDISEYPVAQRALREKVPLVEESWSWDPDFKVNSITGYAPVFARNGAFVGVLAMDMVDTDVRAIISNATTIALIVVAVALALTVGSSILLGTLFTYGIIRLDRVVRTFDKDNMHVRSDVRTRDEVGRLSISFNTMAETIQEYSARQTAFLEAYGKFVPHEFIRLLEKGSILDVKLGDQTQKDMTVLFSDIMSFTSLSESMTPEQNFNFINSYLRRMGPEIRANGGFIDKYIGDEIMALFPAKPDDALAAAVAMRQKLVEYNSHRAKSGYRPIAVGFGVNLGKLMLGTVGEHERMDGSVIADAVNLCSRVQTLTRVYGSSILTTGHTLKSLSNPRTFSFRFIDRVRVRGKQEAILLFEILDGANDEPTRRRVDYKEDLARALRLYFGRDFKSSLEIVKTLREKNPSDKILSIYQRRCENLITLGAPPEWEGVEMIEVY